MSSSSKATVEEVQAWLAEHAVRRVTTQATTLSGLVAGKHLSTGKLLAALGRGHGLSDTVPIGDYGGTPAFGWRLGPWQGELRDVFLRPDPATLALHPTLDRAAVVICDVCDVRGEPLPICGRSLLRHQVERLAEFGLQASVAVEVEATVFENSLEDARRRSYGGLTPLGGERRLLCDAAPSQQVTLFMDGVWSALDSSGIELESWSTEDGGGAIELNLPPRSPVRAADDVVRAKLALRAVAAKLGHSVTLMARWNLAEAGCGLHVNHSLWRGDENTFFSPAEPMRDELRQWLGGLMATLPSAVSLLLPNVNSFRRLAEARGAPTRSLWGVDNKSVAVRVVSDSPKSARVEHRVPGADANIYVALAAILAGGIAGLEERLTPPAPFRGLGWGLPDGFCELPATIVDAARLLAGDQRLRRALGDTFIDYWLGTRRWEWYAFHTMGGNPEEINSWERGRYFETA